MIFELFVSHSREVTMSLTHDAPIAAPAKPPPSLLRRLRFPLGVLVVCGVIFAIPWVGIALGLDTDRAITFFMITQWHVPALGMLLLAVWWVFFSPVRWRTRLAGALAILLLGAGF